MLRPLPTQSEQRVPKKCVWGRSPRRAALALVLCVTSPALAAAQSYSLAWNQNPDPVTVGYVVFGGLQPGNYVWSADVGRATTASLPPLPPGNSYYFVVRARDAAGMSAWAASARRAALIVLGGLLVSCGPADTSPRVRIPVGAGGVGFLPLLLMREHGLIDLLEVNVFGLGL